MNNFTVVERFFALILNKFPGFKSLVKKAYLSVNSLFFNTGFLLHPLIHFHLFATKILKHFSVIMMSRRRIILGKLS